MVYEITVRGKVGEPWITRAYRVPSLESAKRRAFADAVVMGMSAPKIVTAKEVQDFEITDAGVIPDEYIIIDRAKIARAVKELKEECNIPGVRAFSRIEVK